MTICAAALAAKSKAIVCIADKAISWGDSITWESDITKIIPLTHPGMVSMFSGGEDGITRVLSALLSRENLGSAAVEIAKECEKEYTKCINELVELKFLAPRLIKLEEYQKAVTADAANSIIEGVHQEVKEFDINCDLLLCGFDANHNPIILEQSSPDGKITYMTNTGFAAIGSGSHYTLSRLLFLTHRRDDDLDKVMYDIFDAKASAEMSPSVGVEWDTVVIYLDKENEPQIKKVDDKINDLIERAWFHYAALSPYEKRDKDDLKPPPKTWKSQLKDYIKTFMPTS